LLVTKKFIEGAALNPDPCPTRPTLPATTANATTRTRFNGNPPVRLKPDTAYCKLNHDSHDGHEIRRVRRAVVVGTVFVPFVSFVPFVF
jgi:hypothetical protein